MQKRFFISLAVLSLTLGIGDFVAQPQPAGAESEAGTEAPMYVGRRRGRRGYRRYGQNNQVNQQQRQQQKMEAQTLKTDQKDAARRAREVGRLKEKDIIHEYSSGKQH